jgi:hypothetical protein
MMKLLATALLMTSAAAFAPSTSFYRSTKTSSLQATIFDSLRGMQGPGQVWGADGIAVGKEESDLKGYDGFGKFCALLQSTGVAQSISGPGPFTVFAPTDSAVETYERTYGQITAQVLAYHIVPGKVPSGSLGSAVLTTQLGPALSYGRRFRKDFVNDAIVGEKTFGQFADFPVDVNCDNGMIHAIGLMLTPP